MDGSTESATLRGYYLRCLTLCSGEQDIDYGRGQIHCLLEVLSGLKDLIHQIHDVDGHRPGDGFVSVGADVGPESLDSDL